MDYLSAQESIREGKSALLSVRSSIATLNGVNTPFGTPPNRITVLAETNFRNSRRRFGIKRADRRAHLYLIGKTGTGKSTMIANLVHQDATNGEGLALLDPHGDLVEQVLARIPPHRMSDVVYFNVPDTARPIAFNPLEVTQAGFRPLVASGLISIFKKMWAEFWGPRMEYVLRNTLLALLEFHGSTLVDVPECSMIRCFAPMSSLRFRMHKCADSGSANIKAIQRDFAQKQSRRYKIKSASFS